MIPPAQAVHHIALQVQDLARSERFYREVLLLPLVRRWPDPEGQGDRSVWLDVGGGAFLALEVVPDGELDRRDGRAGWHLVALRIPPSARADWVARLEAAGHPIERQTSFTIYVRDPEGNRIGLSHWPEPEHAAHHV